MVGQAIVEITAIQMGGQEHLLVLVDANRTFALFLGFGKSRQKHTGQDRDNGNDY
jgi:hypothetical protein